MKDGSDKHHRRSLRLPGCDYSRKGAYFVTVCTWNKECFLGEIENREMHVNAAGDIAGQCWRDIPAHFPHVACDMFVIMPNHIHGILFVVDSVWAKNFSPKVLDASERAKNFSPLQDQRPVGTSKTIGSVVRGFKIGVTKWMRQNTSVQNVWQRNYFEHIIRNDAELTRIRQYILDNPAKWDLDRDNPNAAQMPATTGKYLDW